MEFGCVFAFGGTDGFLALSFAYSVDGHNGQESGGVFIVVLERERMDICNGKGEEAGTESNEDGCLWVEAQCLSHPLKVSRFHFLRRDFLHGCTFSGSLSLSSSLWIAARNSACVIVFSAGVPERGFFCTAPLYHVKTFPANLFSFIFAFGVDSSTFLRDVTRK